ncbi:MAG: S9 family peptidase [Erythrobacter sp.]|jgi:dipeptidyl aminopeptidase/acylaminoacyl peptidase|nr:S9 family peptidase [Erythrobacter sp.]
MNPPHSGLLTQAIALALALGPCFPATAGESASPIEGLEKPAMTAADLVTMPRLGGPVVSPFGRTAVFSVTRTDPETLERRAEHYTLDLIRPGAEPKPLMLEFDASALAFGPGGRLYFLSDHANDDAEEGNIRLWRIGFEAGAVRGEPELVAGFAGTDITGFELAPDESKVALMATLDRTCTSLACKTQAARIGSGRLYDGKDGFYRHWDSWVKPGIYNRVFVYDLEDGVVSGEGVPLDGVDPASGLTGNTPTMPFGGNEDVAWAPDSSGVFFVARETGRDEPTSTDLDIYFSDLAGGPPQILTGANAAHDSTPVPSPDGRRLAYLAMERPGYESDRMIVHMRDLSTGETRALTADTDLSFGSLAWSNRGDYLLATAQSVLDTPLYRIDAATGEVTELDLIAGQEAHIANVTVLPGERLLFTRDSVGVPAELYLARGLANARPLTDIATTRTGELASTITTRFSFEGANGDTVWGQITRLENQEGPIPALLFIHGGPQGSFNDAWSSRWNPRVFASQGYAVISIDFHGSSGYGQDFMDAINQDWGGKPLVDLQKGLVAALALDPQIDGTRTCALGASYGGYMINWIAGNWPDRFDCLVQHDGLFDMRSFYYSTEELWFPRWDFGGSYAQNAEVYEKWNPANHVDKWQTPMLVITGQKDFRVPYTQGLQSFTALQERGIPSQLLVFPDENHWVLGAANSLQWHETVFAWLDRWLSEKPDE